MAGEVAGDESRSACRAAPFAGSALGGFDDVGMAGQVEVVAAGKEQNVSTVDGHARGLQAVEHAHSAIRPTFANFSEHLIGNGVESARPRPRRSVQRARTPGRAHARAISGLSNSLPPPGMRN